MGTSYRFVAYVVIVLVLSAVLLTWISHMGSTGRKAKPPKAVAIPTESPPQTPRPAPTASGNSPSQTSTPFYSPQEEGRSSAETDARSAQRHSDPEVGTSPDVPYVPSFSTPSDGEASAPDSDQSSSPSKGESAEQRLIRRLKGH